MSNPNQLFSPIVETPSSAKRYTFSGIVGVETDNMGALTAPETIEEQTHLAIDSLENQLGPLGLNLRYVHKIGLYVVGITANYNAVNEVYVSRFAEVLGGQPMPARTAFGVDALAPITENPLLIELDAIAAAAVSYPPHYASQWID